MFLNLSPPSTDAPSVLIDQNVNYYGFLESKEHDNWMKSIEGQMLTSVIYESPYFGTMPSGAYRQLDEVYEAYRQRVKSSLSIEHDPTRVVKTGTAGGVNTALILAVAAAAFFIGG